MRQETSLEIRWTDWEDQGSEQLTLHIGNDDITAESDVKGWHEDIAYQLNYRLALDAGWRMRRLSVRLDDGRERHFAMDEDGQWWCETQGLLSSLTGCTDIDISATPFTNTLPIRRLGLAIGESANLSVALLSVPELTIRAVPQRYTRLSSHGWRYEGLDSDFTAYLEVDDYGVVLDYSNLFRRQPPREGAF